MTYRLSRIKRPVVALYNDRRLWGQDVHTSSLAPHSSETPEPVFLRFTPLRSKKPSRAQLETYRRRINPIGISHYRYGLTIKDLPERSKIDPGFLQQLQSPLDQCSYYAGPYCWQSYFRLGDVVEARKTNGDVVFGMVVSPVLVSLLKIFTIDGEVIFIKRRDVLLVLSQLYNYEFVKRHVKDQEMNDTLKFHLMTHMKLMILSSTALAQEIAPILEGCLPRRRSGLQAVGLSHAVSLVQRQITLVKSPLISLATYLCLSEELRYARPLDSYPFVTLPRDTYTSVLKVMKRLTPEELDNFGEILAQSRQSTGENGTNSILVQFLRYYIINPDFRLAEAVRALLSRIYPVRDSTEWLTAPSSVWQMLSGLGSEAGATPSLLVPGSVAWLRPNTSELDLQMSKALPDGSIPNIELIDDLKPQIEYVAENFPGESGISNNASWESNPDPVFVLGDFKDIGVSISTTTRQWKFSVYTPMIAYNFRQGSELDKLLKRRGKTMMTRSGTLHLIPQTVRESWVFSKDKFTPSICFSVTLEPWDLKSLFTSEKVSVELVNVVDPIYLSDGARLATEMGWQTVDGEPVAVPRMPNFSFLQKEAEHFQTAQKLFHNHSERSRAYSGRTFTEMLANIREVLQGFFWQRIESGALYDAHLAAKTYEKGVANKIFGLDDIMREARLCAGYICAMFARNKNILLPFLGQQVLSSETDPALQRLLTNKRVWGTLSPRDYTVASCYYGKEEVFDKPHEHRGLGLPAYVNVGYPLQDYTAIVNQWRLGDYLEQRRAGADRRRPPFLPRVEWWVKRYFEHEILPQHELLDTFSDRLHRVGQLEKLETQLRSSEGYFIFRCAFIESGMYPDICRAFCEELGTIVDVVLAPHTKVDLGDTVVCTEIIELNAADELIVLGF